MMNLESTDTINLDGTVTRLLCPDCRTPVRARLGRGGGYYCPDRANAPHTEGTTHVPTGVTYRPLIVRVSIPLDA